MCFYEALERMKEKGKGQNLLTAISFFFFFPSNQNLKFCVIMHISSKSSVAWFPRERTLFITVISSEDLVGCSNQRAFLGCVHANAYRHKILSLSD